MAFIRIVSTTMVMATIAPLTACREPSPSTTAATSAPVLLVCEHGSVKSLMAASLFNQAATGRGLPFRAIARGITPDEEVPSKIVEALTAEGFDVKGFKPTRVSTAEMSKAARIVAIGVDLSPFTPSAPVAIEQWNDVPAASMDYSAAHRVLKQHVDVLLNRLQSETH
jgi:arsenate reductase